MIATSALPAPAPSPGLAARRGFITLGAQAWGAIRGEYLAGATAKQISQKWGCSVVAVYDHASKGGWTKRVRGEAISATVLAETRAEQAQRSARAALPAAEAPPLLAAGVLLRQAAASALMGETASALKSVQLAESLARAARLISEAEHGIVESRADLLARAKQALEDDPDYEPAGWRDSAEAKALTDQLLQGFARLRRERDRTPPQHLPMWFMLDDHETHRPLAEALCLVVEGQAWVECPDFEAAVERARAAGRGEEIDRALSTPIPWAQCTWMSEARKAVVAAREAEAQGRTEAGAAEPVSGEDDAVEGAGVEAEVSVEVAEAGPAVRRLSEGEAPWPSIRRGGPPGLSGPYVPLS